MQFTMLIGNAVTSDGHWGIGKEPSWTGWRSLPAIPGLFAAGVAAKGPDAAVSRGGAPCGAADAR